MFIAIGGIAVRTRTFRLGILGPLTVSTAGTLGGQTLVAKGGPRTKVFASLAPLDFQIFFGVLRLVHGGIHDPHRDIARGTDPLILPRDNVHRGIGRRRGCVAPIDAIGRRGTNPQQSAHDAVALTIGRRARSFPRSPGLSARQMFGEIHELRKIRQLQIVIFRAGPVDIL